MMASMTIDCANPERKEHTEYVRIDSMSARVRPTLSAIDPNSTPPMPDASSVNVFKNPAMPFDMPRSRITAVITTA